MKVSTTHNNSKRVLEGVKKKNLTYSLMDCEQPTSSMG